MIKILNSWFNTIILFIALFFVIYCTPFWESIQNANILDIVINYNRYETFDVLDILQCFVFMLIFLALMTKIWITTFTSKFHLSFMTEVFPSFYMFGFGWIRFHDETYTATLEQAQNRGFEKKSYNSLCVNLLWCNVLIRENLKEIEVNFGLPSVINFVFLLKFVDVGVTNFTHLNDNTLNTTQQP